MQFDQIPGQKNTKQQLIRSLRLNRLGHALLFSGPQECGQLAAALALSQIMVCTNQQENGLACENCNSCKKAAKLIHPDIHFTYPTVGSKAISKSFLSQWREIVLENPFLKKLDWLNKIEAGNSQGNITNKECEEIIKTLSLKSFEANVKIQIIWQAEKLGLQGNTLLKLIEEPPPGTLMILTTSAEENILNTILSRTQLFHFRRAALEEVRDHLINYKQIEAQQAAQLAELSNGFIGDALKLMDDRQAETSKQFLEWVDACRNKNIIAMNAWVDGMGRNGREQQKHFIAYLLMVFDWLLRGKAGVQTKFHASESEQQLVNWLVPRLSTHEIEKLSTIFSKAHYYVERNVHARLLFYNLSIQLSRTLNKIS